MSQGVAPAAVSAAQHRFDSLVIGPETIARPILRVAPMGTIGSTRKDMLVGGDYLRRHRVWLSYATGMVYIAPLKAAAP